MGEDEGTAVGLCALPMSAFWAFGRPQMLRLRFLPGLILGLLVGLPVGIGVGVLTLAPHGSEQNVGASPLVQDLTRKLEAAKDERDRADRQLEQFQKLADQMTKSFNNLEMRFKLLEEEQRVRDAQAQAAIPARAPAPPPPPPTGTAPVQALPPQTPTAQEPDDAEAPADAEPATQVGPEDPGAAAPAEPDQQ
jgi:TolA-binding protein